MMTPDLHHEPVDDMHPYRLAWESRDLERWGRSLAADVVMNSPVFSRPFVGREVAIELFDSLFEAVDDFRITDELSSQTGKVFLWQASHRGRTIEGADLIRADQDGLVCEITVLIRPLVGIGIFGQALGPRLAGKRGKLRAVVVRVLNAPLAPLFRLVDVIGSRLLVPSPRTGRARAVADRHDRAA